MENRYRHLEQTLAEFAQIFSARLSDIGSEGGERSTLPHIELIDFDKLCNTFKEAMAAMETADKNYGEGEIVRKWLMTRITSFRRGRQAICAMHEADGERGSLDKVTLPELVHLFEEESARLRQTAVGDKLRRCGQSSRIADEYMQFKS